MRLSLPVFFSILLSVSSFARSAVGQEPAADAHALPAVIKVGISPFSPFSITDRKVPAGFSIDLWASIAREMNLQYELVSFPGVAQKLQALQSQRIAVAIGGITITRQRERHMDFSHPTFRTGLDIMLPAGQIGFSWSAIGRIITPGKLGIMIAFILLIIISGHLVWLAERGKDAFNDKYIPGVIEGMYWAIVTASTVGYGDKAPVKWAGRMVASLVIIISLPMFALFTAELASSFTLESMQSSIQGPGDLEGRQVGVLRGTASAWQVLELKASCVLFECITDAYQALKQGDLDAVVYDAPNMQYYLERHGEGRVTLLGKLFMKQLYGIAVYEKSPLLEGINLAILELTESGELDRIRADWFGRQ